MRLVLLRPRPAAAVVTTTLALFVTACSTRAAPPPEPDRTTKIGCAGTGGASWLVPIIGVATVQAAAALGRIGVGPCGFVPTGVVAVTTTACAPTDLVIDGLAGHGRDDDGLRPADPPAPQPGQPSS